MPLPVRYAYNNADFTRNIFAPNSNDQVWECIGHLKNYVQGLEPNYIAGIRGGNEGIVFRRHETSANLITIWPSRDSLRVVILSNNENFRIQQAQNFNCDQFNLSFDNFQHGILEIFQRPEPLISLSRENCTKANLAPDSNDAVWDCIDRIRIFVSTLSDDYCAVKGGDQGNRLIHFRTSEQSNHDLVFIMPRDEYLEVMVRLDLNGHNAIWNEAGARGNYLKRYTPNEFLQAINEITEAIHTRYENR